MTSKRFKTAYIISIFILVLSTIASTGGLLLPNLYQDNAVYTRVWQGNDIVTLTVAVPLLAIGLFLLTRGSQRGYLIWVGTLAYMTYNYAYYLFGTAFNRFFLLYVILLALSVFAMAFSLPRLDAQGIRQSFRSGAPTKVIAGFLILVGVMLSFGEIPQVVSAAIANQDTAAPSLIFALDLTFIVPGLMLAGVWLWMGKVWGYILSAMMMVTGGTYALTLSLVSGLADPLEPLWIFICVGCLICGVLLITNMQPARPRAEQTIAQLNKSII